MLRKLMAKIRRVLDRKPKPVIRYNVHKPCDACGQISGKLIDGMCDWCDRFFGAYK